MLFVQRCLPYALLVYNATPEVLKPLFEQKRLVPPTDSWALPELFRALRGDLTKTGMVGYLLDLADLSVSYTTRSVTLTALDADRGGLHFQAALRLDEESEVEFEGGWLSDRKLCVVEWERILELGELVLGRKFSGHDKLLFPRTARGECPPLALLDNAERQQIAFLCEKAP